MNWYVFGPILTVTCLAVGYHVWHGVRRLRRFKRYTNYKAWLRAERDGT